MGLDTSDYEISKAIAEIYFVSSGSLNNIIKTVCREFHWEPNAIGSFFIDSIDHFGLWFWYNDVEETTEELQAKIPKDKK